MDFKSFERAKVEGCRAYLNEFCPRKWYYGVVIIESGVPRIQVVYEEERWDVERSAQILAQIPTRMIEFAGKFQEFVLEVQGMAVVFCRAIGEGGDGESWLVAWMPWTFFRNLAAMLIPDTAQRAAALLNAQLNLGAPSTLSEDQVWTIATKIRDGVLGHVRSSGSLYDQRIIRTARENLDYYGVEEEVDKRLILRVVSAFFFERVNWGYIEGRLIGKEELKDQLTYYLRLKSDLSGLRQGRGFIDRKALVEEIRDLERHLQERYGLGGTRLKQRLSEVEPEWREWELRKELNDYLWWALKLEAETKSNKKWLVENVQETETWITRKFKLSKKEFKSLFNDYKSAWLGQVESLKVLLEEEGYAVTNSFQVEVSTQRGLFKLNLVTNDVCFEATSCDTCGELMCNGKLLGARGTICVEPMNEGWSNLQLGSEQLALISFIHALKNDALPESILNQMNDVCPRKGFPKKMLGESVEPIK